MVDEEVGFGALVLDMIRKNFRIRSFEPSDKKVLNKHFCDDRIMLATHIILSPGREELMAEMTSVLQDLTFSVMPSLSIMIIYRMSGFVQRKIRAAHVSSCVEESVGPIYQPTRVARASRFEFSSRSISSSSPSKI